MSTLQAARPSVSNGPTARKSAEPVTISALVNYTRPPPSGESLYRYVGSKPEHVKAWSNGVSDPVNVDVRNLRNCKTEDLSLHQQGFKLANFDVPADLDWGSNSQVEAVYYPLVEQLLKKHTGASRVHVFDQTQRRGSMRNGDQSQKPDSQGNRPPVAVAHVDYTPQSGIDRLHALLPDEAERLQKTPFAVVQVWRPITGPIDDSPLAMADASTVAPEDLMPNLLHFPERTGHVLLVKANPQHRWYYAKGLQVDEAYIFVCYDSRKDRARFTPHTGILDPTTTQGAPDRHSVEARAYCFWEDLPAAAPSRDL